MSDLQWLYGLTVRSDRPLFQDRCVAEGSPVDVSISTGEPIGQHAEHPDGVSLLSHGQEGRDFYSAVRLPDGSFVLRFDGSCEFRMTPSLSHVVVHSVKGSDPALATILTTGGMLAFQLYLRSHPVLHASAVDVGGKAIAFVGHSGMGKSTMAALMCADGARIITDDVLRLDFESGCDGADVVRARLGATELRLRKGADTLLERFQGSTPHRRMSADQRHVLGLRGDADDLLPLAGIVIPRPDRRRACTALRRVEGKRAVLALLSFPRLIGWRERKVLNSQLSQLGRLASAVPVFVADVPWGPPFPVGIAAAIATAVGAAAQSGSAESSAVK